MTKILFFESSFCDSNRRVEVGVFRYAKSARWNVQMVPYAAAAAMQQSSSMEGGRPDVKALLEFWRPAGALVCCGAAPDIIRKRDFGNTPVVFLVEKPGDVAQADCVVSDRRAVAEVAARELLSLNLQSYAFVPSPRTTRWSRCREEVFGEIVRLNGREFRVFRGGTGSKMASARRLCKWLADLPKPCGVFAANDVVGERVLSCAARCGIKVPEELSVIGVDDDPMCERMSPTLTSIVQDYEGAGVLGAKLLAARMADDSHCPETLTFGVKTVRRRASTYAAVHRDGRVAQMIETIRRRACEPLRACDVFSATGCSRRLGELRFREATGRSVLEEIQRVRIERAVELLEHTDNSIARVAALCGYGSTESLRKVFAAHHGCSPAEWRRRCASV